MTGVLAQISVSAGGMPKLPVDTALVTAHGVGGDRQHNMKYHSGPDRAVCLYSVEWYAWLREQGVDLAYGQVGENFTTRGIDLLELHEGDYLSVGVCLIQLASVRVPCKQLNMWHPNLFELITGRTGWLARVVREGSVKAGDAIALANEPAGSIS